MKTVIKSKPKKNTMEKFEIQALLHDGSFVDYEVQTERHSDKYEVFKDGKPIASFRATKDGGWEIENNQAQIDEDLQHRITLQLNGYRIS